MAKQNPNLMPLVGQTKHTFILGNSIGNVILPSVSGATQYYMPKLPRGLYFDTTTRTLTGSPSEVNNKHYEYIAVNGNQIGVFNIHITVYRTQAQKDSDYANDSRHDLIFYKTPINYGSGIRNKVGTTNVPFIADNNYNTAHPDPTINSNTQTYWINTRKDSDTTSDGTKITHVFFKTKNVNSFYTNLTGTDFPTNSTPKYIVDPKIAHPEDSDEDNAMRDYKPVFNWEGRETRIDGDGFQNFLWELPQAQNDSTDITVTVNGTNVRVYEIMVLEKVLSLNANGQFSQITYSLQDFGSILKKDLAERVQKVPKSGSPRWQHQVEYTALLQSSQVNSLTAYDTDTHLSTNREVDIYNSILNIIKDRTLNNMVVSCEWTRYPERVFPATFPNTEIGVAYLSERYTGSGETVNFSILES